MEKVLLVKDVLNYFKYRQICGNEESLNRKIEVADINRPGLELSGYFEYSQPRRVIILGGKEISYIEKMSTEKQRESFEYLTNEHTPMILLSKDHVCPPLLLEIAQQKNFPIFVSYAPTKSLMVELVSYLEENLAVFDNIHGVLMNVYGVGVLLRGKSGVGKSEIALELIKKGHILIADDRVDVARIHNKIIGVVPELLKDMLEIRGLGIIDVTKLFGITASAHQCQLKLVIDLQRWDTAEGFERKVNEEKSYETLFGIDIPKIVFPVREGRSMAELIETAVTDYILKERGIDCSRDFEDRIYQNILNKKGNEE